MDPTTVEALKEALDNFLDHPKDKELEREYVEMLKQRSVYSFLSILHRIKYDRLSMLLNVTNDIVCVYSSNKNKIESSSSSLSSTIEEETETSSEEDTEMLKCRAGTAFDLLMDEEC